MRTPLTPTKLHGGLSYLYHPMKFDVRPLGFGAPERYKLLYVPPAARTVPHVFGSLDTIIYEPMSPEIMESSEGLIAHRYTRWKNR